VNKYIFFSVEVGNFRGTIHFVASTSIKLLNHNPGFFVLPKNLFAIRKSVGSILTFLRLLLLGSENP